MMRVYLKSVPVFKHLNLLQQQKVSEGKAIASGISLAKSTKTQFDDTLFFIIPLPLEFLPASGPTELWCASTLGAALLCRSRGFSMHRQAPIKAITYTYNTRPRQRVHLVSYSSIIMATVPCPKRGSIHRRRVMPLIKQALYPQATTAWLWYIIIILVFLFPITIYHYFLLPIT